MSKSNIHQVISHLQDPRIRISTMPGIAFTHLVQNIIREYGIYDNESYFVDLMAINLSDKKLVLSHVTDAEEYEWACGSDIRVENLFNEYAKYIQNIFADQCDDLFNEDMYEMGMVLEQHSDNGENYWVKG